MGAVLTQNTAWTNADAALGCLRQAGVRLPSDILALPRGRLARLIRSSGYFNQKARKLRVVAALFSRPRALTAARSPSREALLSEWGIGAETADSILLYAFHKPVFVVDAYTRRVLSRIGLIKGSESYEDIQALFHDALEKDAALYSEYHALIVQHAKRHCTHAPGVRLLPGQALQLSPPAGLPESASFESAGRAAPRPAPQVTRPPGDLHPRS